MHLGVAERDRMNEEQLAQVDRALERYVYE
jgi:hypothetical protein